MVMMVPPFATVNMVSPKGAFKGDNVTERMARDLEALRTEP